MARKAKAAEPEKKKRGRPAGSKNKKASTATKKASTGRKAGRPRKVASGGGFGAMHEGSSAKHKKATSSAMKKAPKVANKKSSKAGRPRKAMGKDGANHNLAKTISYMNAGTKKRGKKSSLRKFAEANMAYHAPKKRGRPAKAKSETVAVKKGPGRPRKAASAAPVAKRKGRGKARTIWNSVPVKSGSVGKRKGRGPDKVKRTRRTKAQMGGVSKGAKMTETSIKATVHRPRIAKVGKVKVSPNRKMKTKRGTLKAA